MYVVLFFLFFSLVLQNVTNIFASVASYGYLIGWRNRFKTQPIPFQTPSCSSFVHTARSLHSAHAHCAFLFEARSLGACSTFSVIAGSLSNVRAFCGITWSSQSICCKITQAFVQMLIEPLQAKYAFKRLTWPPWSATFCFSRYACSLLSLASLHSSLLSPTLYLLVIRRTTSFSRLGRHQLARLDVLFEWSGQPYRSIPAYATGFRYVDLKWFTRALKNSPGPRPLWARV